MQKRLLLQSQKNTILDVIQNSKLHPIDFAWSEAPMHENAAQSSAIVSVLVHKPTEYSFVFDARDLYRVAFSPGLSGSVFHDTHVRDWHAALSLFIHWIEALEIEASSPDLWAEIRKESALLAASENDEANNERFSDTEQSDVHQKIDEMLKFLTAIKSGDESFHRYARNRLEYLKDASSRLGRKDFKAILVGTLCGLVLQAGMNSTQASDFFRFVGTLFSSVWKHLLN